MSSRWRIVVAVAFVAAAVGLFLALRESDDEGPGDAALFTLTVPAEGPSTIEELDVDEGQTVVLTIELEEAGEIHIHGYDLSEVTGPEQPPAIFDFVADVTGAFEIEIHETEQQIAELRVSP